MQLGYEATHFIQKAENYTHVSWTEIIFEY